MALELDPYRSAFLSLCVLGLLWVVQATVADLALVRAKHVPGTPIPGGHDSFVFRAARAHANTNENVGTWAFVAIACILFGVSAAWVNTLAWVFTGARGVHMIAYYADIRPLRSGAFAIGLLATGALAVLGLLGR